VGFHSIIKGEEMKIVPKAIHKEFRGGRPIQHEKMKKLLIGVNDDLQDIILLVLIRNSENLSCQQNQ